MNQFKRKKEEIKALAKYPELYGHLGYTIQAKKDYEDIKKENSTKLENNSFWWAKARVHPKSKQKYNNKKGSLRLPF